jgi:hypothetical protein
VSVRNLSKRHVVLYLEPWGEEINMPVDRELIIVGEGPQRGSGFTVDYAEHGMTVTGWTGSIVRVFSNGQQIVGSPDMPPVPDFDS